MGVELTRRRIEPPSGEQVELRCGAYRAVVVEVGGALRTLRTDGADLLDGYAEGEMCGGARGQPLIPWPNRLEDGRYDVDGRTLQVPLTEPARSNAIHGLVRWANWTATESSPGRVVMRHRLHPQPGYPFTLDLALEYVLAEDGLTVRTTATNVGDRPCPYGAGAHPYLTVGTGTIDGALLRAPGARHLRTDGRGIPTGSESVDGTGHDFRAARPLAGVRLDDAYTGLERDESGRAWVTLSARAGGRWVSLWMDGSYRYLELFTGDSLPDPRRRRTGLGVEPMTCAPNAFRNRAGLRVLQPGETAEGTWGIVAGTG